MKQITLCLIIVLFLFGCDDDNPFNSQHDPNLFYLDQYPLDVGLTWEYEIYDSLKESNNYDTIYCSITEEQPADHNVTNYILKSKIGNEYEVREIFNVYNDLHYMPLGYYNDFYHFPFGEDSVMVQMYGTYYDSSLVEKKDTVVTPYGIYPNGFYVTKNWDNDFEGGYKKSTTVVVPDIGQVKRILYSLHNTGGGIVIDKNEVWTLIEFNDLTCPYNDFPLQENYSWTYRVNDISRNDTTLEEVTIVDDSYKYDDKDCYLMESRIDGEYDTTIIKPDYNQLTFYPDTSVFALDYTMRFPLAVGQNWEENPVYPILGCVDKETIVVPAGQFECFKYIDIFQDYNFSQYTYLWIAPEVGIVKKELHIFSVPSSQKVYELIEFKKHL